MPPTDATLPRPCFKDFGHPKLRSGALRDLAFFLRQNKNPWTWSLDKGRLFHGGLNPIEPPVDSHDSKGVIWKFVWVVVSNSFHFNGLKTTNVGESELNLPLFPWCSWIYATKLKWPDMYICWFFGDVFFSYLPPPSKKSGCLGFI